MRWLRVARIVGGMLLILLGLLWILQGADLIHIDPVLCVADCRPVTGGSPGWLIAGVVTAVVGAVLAGVRRGSPKSGASSS